MDLIVFDLDGTLLNKASTISDYTRETLCLLKDHDIAYTVATGRTLHASAELIKGQNFTLPHIYKNGVMIWHPNRDEYSHKYLLTEREVERVLQVFIAQKVTPFVFTLEENNQHCAYHATVQSEVEVRFVEELSINRRLPLLPISELPPHAQITNISALGPSNAIDQVIATVAEEEHLVAYRGAGMQHSNIQWLDIHHSEGSKGAAIEQLKQDLAVSRVICFGDSDNDLSMFALADEAYAPENALDEVKEAASAVIGHHDQDGIARFLRERFSL